MRGTVEPVDGGYGLVLGPAWVRDCAVTVGVEVPVELAPEGPQRGELARGRRAALAADPAPGRSSTRSPSSTAAPICAGSTSTKRRPQLRAERIAEVVALLAAGIKERPRP